MTPQQPKAKARLICHPRNYYVCKTIVCPYLPSLCCNSCILWLPPHASPVTTNKFLYLFFKMLL